MADEVWPHGAITTYDSINNKWAGTTPLVLDGNNQSTALVSTTINTPTLGGMYLLTCYARLTQAATTSSIMGPITANWTCNSSGAVLNQVIQMSTVFWGQIVQSGLMAVAGVTSKSVTFIVPYTSVAAPSISLTWQASSPPSGHQSLWGIQANGSAGNWTGFTVYFGGTVTGNYSWMAAGVSNGQNVVDASNQVGAGLCGSLIINAKAGTPINISIGYTSVGATPMLYAYHLKSVFLGAAA